MNNKTNHETSLINNQSLINKPVFFTSAGLIAAVCLFGGVFTQQANIVFNALQSWLITNVGWFYMAAVASFFIFVIYLAFSRFAQIKLGPDDSEPDYTYLSWFAMLFSAGMGIGLLFFGVAEPITHFMTPPLGEGGDIDAARNAMQITFFHWGLQAWAIYIVVGLSLAYFAFRHDLPLTIRSTLYPLIGDRIHGPIGHAVDIFAVLGTMFGVATSLGLGVMQVNAGMNYLFGIPINTTVQVLLITAITGIATVSVVAGLDAGIKRLSVCNLILALILMIFILIAGPTVLLLNSLIQNIGMYLSNMVEMTLKLYAYEPTEWIGDWTLFYWAWWISWSPFVGMFIARISRGRTIKEFIIGVLLVPTGFTFMWLSLFGNTALHMELAETGAGITEAVQNDMPTAIFVLLEQMPLATITSLLTTVLVVTFFVTSSDSGSLVIDIITSGGAEEPPVWQRIFWAISEGGVASILLIVGGLTALQTAALTSALPFSIVILVICYALYKGLNMEGERRMSPLPVANAPMQHGQEGEKVWQNRLKALLGKHKRQDVADYVTNIALPAMHSVVKQLKIQHLEAFIDEHPDSIQLNVESANEQIFLYKIRLRKYSAASMAFPELPGRGKEDSYWRAEVYLSSGPQHYDVAGYTQDQLMNDILVQFQLHVQFMHIDL